MSPIPITVTVTSPISGPMSGPVSGASASREAAPQQATARRARCADGHGTLSGLFFSDDLVDIARAKAICSRCTLRVECLERALERAEPWGVWGGELIDTGRVVVHKRPRGRPPKIARAALVVDELLSTPASTAIGGRSVA